MVIVTILILILTAILLPILLYSCAFSGRGEEVIAFIKNLKIVNSLGFESNFYFILFFALIFVPATILAITKKKDVAACTFGISLIPLAYVIYFYEQFDEYIKNFFEVNEALNVAGNSIYLSSSALVLISLLIVIAFINTINLVKCLLKNK